MIAYQRGKTKDQTAISGTARVAELMRISVPEPSLVVLCGPAGAGKTTFARRHFRRTQTVSSDKCRALVGDDETDLAVSKDAFDLLYYLIHKRLKLGRLTVVDSTALALPRRERLLTIAREHRAPAVLVVFNVDAETCRRRNRARRRQVPEPAILNHQRLLREAIQSVRSEGFDQLYVLGPDIVVDVEVVPRSAAVSDC